ncbi:PaaI family thioesterase [Aminipila butyrica]|uniref:Acyl-coenzyme A thioesterase THEM4 n=1 Tax=Aminipila butyrica TaxID=433296 RepID=A0A858BZQ3_9FIRM|nr:PaaI family thioesterase [Aminipila butyrica]QIB70244.1 PaaI family thioesterase [Aminipila butyrica]
MRYKVIKKQNNSARCVVCGTENKLSLNTRFYETEDGHLTCTFRTEDWHQSYPGRTHGGLSAAVLDELIGRTVCIQEPDCWGVTVELNLKYKKPVPTEANLKGIARMTRNTRKIFEGEGQLLLPDGTVAVEATGKYMKMPVSQIAEGDFVDSEWYLLTNEEDPEEIDL